MQILRRRKEQPAVNPAVRHVTRAGHTAMFSYHTVRNNQKTTSAPKQPSSETRIQHTKKGEKRSRVMQFTALVAIAMVILWNLGLSTAPTVIIEGTAAAYAHSRSVYDSAATAALDSSILNRTKLTIKTGAIEQTLRNRFPELLSVTVTLPFVGAKPTITLLSAEPSFILQTTSGMLYVVDDGGKAIVRTTSATVSTLHLVTVKDESGEPVSTGRLVVATTTVTFIRTILQQMALQHVGVSGFVLPAASSELDLYPQGSSYYVRFNLESGTALQQVGTFLAVRHKLESGGVVPSNYIDVRIDGRAYYK